MMKTCSCGRTHTEPPKDARVQNTGDAFDGIYWECSCGSTIFFPRKKIEDWEFYYGGKTQYGTHG